MNGWGFKGPSGIRTDRGLKYTDIEAEARMVRRMLAPGVPLNHSLPGVQLFERLGRAPVAVRIEPAVEKLPFGVEGQTLYDAKRGRIILSISEETYSALEFGGVRARFTVFHELGHAVLHTAEMQRTGAIAHQMVALHRGMVPTHKSWEDSEWQANSFASAILMPAQGLAMLEAGPGGLTSSAVEAAFGVSNEAARYRIDNFRQRRASLLRA